MSDNRIPKGSPLCMAIWKRQDHAFHGVKLRWKDRVKKDLSCLFIPRGRYRLAQDRKCWYDLCHVQMSKKINQCIKEEGKKHMAKTASHPTSIFEFSCNQCQQIKFQKIPRAAYNFTSFIQHLVYLTIHERKTCQQISRISLY